jgi:hypothetical protein
MAPPLQHEQPPRLVEEEEKKGGKKWQAGPAPAHDDDGRWSAPPHRTKPFRVDY